MYFSTEKLTFCETTLIFNEYSINTKYYSHGLYGLLFTFVTSLYISFITVEEHDGRMRSGSHPHYHLPNVELETNKTKKGCEHIRMYDDNKMFLPFVTTRLRRKKLKIMEY